MLPLRAASDAMTNIFLGLFDEPLDYPAPRHRLIELTATLLCVMAPGLDLDFLFVSEPAQMPLEKIQGPQSPGHGLRGLSSGLLEHPLLVPFQLTALFFETAHHATGLCEHLRPLFLLALAYTGEGLVALWSPHLHYRLLPALRRGQLNACRMPSVMPSKSEGSNSSCCRNFRILGISTSASSISGLLPFT